MTDVRICAPRWKIITAIAIGFITAATAILIPVHRHASRGNALWVVISTVAFGYAYIVSGRSLRIGKEALEEKNRLSKGRYIPWSDIDKIGIAAFPSTARGQLTYSYFVGIRLHEGAFERNSGGYQSNRKECGYDILLDSHHGFSIERLIVFLNEKKQEAEMANL